MSTIKGLVIGADGKIMKPGRLVRTRTTSFQDGVPSWITVRSDGNYAGASTPANTGVGKGITLTSSAVASKHCEIRGETIDLTTVNAIRMNIHCTGGADANKTVWFGFRPATANTGGLVMKNAAGEGDLKFVGYNAAATEKRYLAEYEWLQVPWGTNPAARYDMTLWLTADKVAYFGEGDNIDAIKEYQDADLNYAALVVPVVAVIGTAGSTSGVTLPVHQITVDEFYF